MKLLDLFFHKDNRHMHFIRLFEEAKTPLFGEVLNCGNNECILKSRKHVLTITDVKNRAPRKENFRK
jgi:hypothetical protein